MAATIMSCSISMSPSLTISGSTLDRKSTRLNSSHSQISYAVFCLKKKICLLPSHTFGSLCCGCARPLNIFAVECSDRVGFGLDLMVLGMQRGIVLGRLGPRVPGVG